MQLIIFEKPKQARSMCSAFGYEDKKSHLVIKPQPTFKDGAIAVWCVGHILEMASPGEIDPVYKEWSLEHLPTSLIDYTNQTKMKEFPMIIKKDTKVAFQEIKKWVHTDKITSIIHAGDSARSGQLIVDEVLIYLKNKKPVQRLWINSLEASAVKKGFNQLKPNEQYYPYYEEALVRSQSDYLIGMTLSRLMTLLIEKHINPNSGGFNKGSGPFSVGRIQSSLLRILVDRDRAISNFRPTPYYELQGIFEKDALPFSAMYSLTGDKITDKTQAQKLADYLGGETGIVDAVEEKPESEEPPLFFNLTSLINEMNKRTQQSPEEIQDIAQSLYEKGMISYPRAAPVVVNPEEALTFPAVLQDLQKNGWGNGMLPAPILDISLNKRYVNEELTDDHYAIVPTTKVPLKEELSTLERLMYQMISHRLITAHYPPAQYQMTKASILVEEEFEFVVKEKRVEHLGWKACLEKERESEKSEETETVSDIPLLITGEHIPLQKVNVIDKMTTAPKRFTQGQLPTVMENISSYLRVEEKEGLSKKELSLGTVATRSSIIKQLMNRHYIVAKKNKIFVQAKGFILIDALGPNNWIASPRTTGLMEQYLADIGNQKAAAPPFVRRTQALVQGTIKEMMEQAPNWQLDSQYVAELRETVSNMYVSIGKCLQCDGEVVDRGDFYGCMNYSTTKCKFSISKKIKGQSISKKQAELILTTKKSDVLNNFMKNDKTGTFKAKVVWLEKEGRLGFEFSGPPTKA